MKKLILITGFFSLTLLSLSLLWAYQKPFNPLISGAKDMNTQNNTSSYVVELAKENAAMAIANAPTLLVVDFYAEWCGPCKTLKPIFEQTATDFKDQYMFAKINIDNCHEIASQYQITSIPTIALFSNGKMIEKITGLVSKEILTEKIAAALKGGPDLSGLSQSDLNEKLLQSIQNVASIEDVKRLIDAGAQAGYIAANGATPLMIAIIAYGSRGADASEIISLLLDKGANTEFTDPKNNSTMPADELASAMAQNLKTMAHNYEKMSALLKSTQKKSSECKDNSCKI